MGKKDRLIEVASCLEGQTKFFLLSECNRDFLPTCKLTGLANFEKILPIELHADFLLVQLLSTKIVQISDTSMKLSQITKGPKGNIF